jgi:alanine racemase
VSFGKWFNNFRYSMNLNSENFPLRPAWTEIDLGKLRRNLQLIRRDLPRHVKLLAVVKDEAYGHGALDVARIALEEGAWGFGLSTLEEAMALRDGGITAPLLLLGERQEAELEWCVAHDLTVCVNEPHAVRALAKIAADFGKQVPVHVKIHTGMSRYGVRWDEALPLIEQILAEKSLLLEGVMTHFAQSDETDKTFANLQFARFNEVWRAGSENFRENAAHLQQRRFSRSAARASGHGATGHFDLRRFSVAGLPADSRHRTGDVGEGAHRGDPKIEARRSRRLRDALHGEDERRIAVLPIGYGDGFPRVRNEGCALIHGRRAPLIGGIAMDALMVDITDIPQAQMWDEAVIMGRQGSEEITVRDIAKLKNSVTYDVLTNWRLRLRRKSVNGK